MFLLSTNLDAMKFIFTPYKSLNLLSPSYFQKYRLYEGYGVKYQALFPSKQRAFFFPAAAAASFGENGEGEPPEKCSQI